MSFQKGDIIVRTDAIYPEGALVVDEFDLAGSLLAHPMGGGLQLLIPSDDIPRFGIANEWERTQVFRRALFTIEDVTQKFEGFTDGRRWNGWGMPRFEFLQAQRVVGVFDPDHGHYNPAIDAFMTITADSEEELWPGEIIALPDGGTTKVYSVGAGSWIWEEEDEDSLWA